MKSLLKAACIAFVTAWNLGVGLALAQTPQRLITIVVPFPAGASTDTLGRLVASNITAHEGRTVVVDNKPGAGGYIGAEFVSRGPNDGSMLLVTVYDALFTNIFNKGQAVASYRVLTPVAGVGKAPYLLFAPASLPAKNMKEFIAMVKASPGKYNMAVNSGAGSHLQSIRFLKEQGMDMAIIPYNSSATLVTAMLAGDPHLYLGSYTFSKQHIESKRLIALGFSGSERYFAAPEIPTLSEQGVPLVTEIFIAVLGPSTMSPTTVAQLNTTINAALDNDATRTALKRNGFVPAMESPAELAARLQKLERELTVTAAAVGIVPQ